MSGQATAPRAGGVDALAIDPNTPGTLYAGTDEGVFRSTDGAMSWQAANVGLPDNTGVEALAIDPLKPGTLYAGTDGGVFKSEDGGSSWQLANTGLPNDRLVSALAIDPITPSTLYAGTVVCTEGCGGGVFKSTDGDSTWTLPHGLFWSRRQQRGKLVPGVGSGTEICGVGASARRRSGSASVAV